MTLLNIVMFIDKFNFSKYGLDVRLVDLSDAEFILDLRTQKNSSKFLSHTSNELDKQIQWLKEYKVREKLQEEVYLIFSKNGINLGVERLYDICSKSFTFGSLVFDDKSPLGTSIIADIITKEIGFDFFNIDIALFDVRKDNKSVIKYHQKYKPNLLFEDDKTNYYSLSKENFKSQKNIFLKMFNKL